jgi:hypothetical protein
MATVLNPCRRAEQLDVPLPDRNDLLLAAGFARAYGSQGLDDPAMAGVRDSFRHMLAGHEPYPALVMDGGWNRLLANQARGPFWAMSALSSSLSRSTSCA